MLRSGFLKKFHLKVPHSFHGNKPSILRWLQRAQPSWVTRSALAMSMIARMSLVEGIAEIRDARANASSHVAVGF